MRYIPLKVFENKKTAENDTNAVHSSGVSRLNVWGRTGCRTNGQKRLDPLVLFWTASGFDCLFCGAQLWADVECDYKRYRPYVSVWINGVQVIRYAPKKGRSRLCLFKAAPCAAGGKESSAVKSCSTQGVHIRFLKDSQAMAGDFVHRLCVHGFYIGDDDFFEDGFAGDSENCAEFVEKAYLKKLFLPLPKKKLMFEFVGDSITSGEGLEQYVHTKTWSPEKQGLRGHFALLLAERFNADISVLAQSGWGLTAGWNNDPACVMPPVYTKVCALAKGTKNKTSGADEEWDFSKRSADAVFINLGTNDEFALDQPAWQDPVLLREYKLTRGIDEDRIQKTLISFIRTIRQCNRSALVFVCYGMVLTGFTDVFEAAVSRYCGETQDSNVFFVRLPAVDKEDALSGGHPGPVCHKRAADVLTEELNKHLSQGNFFPIGLPHGQGV
ncbi:MAG: GDSL-type esterase/lipase family protein [Treponema lecithinolyticum]|uniref:GDSL-type esterase/lipase family protein n=1 Tax=Treponema lecithinolyticum TaxID=53418 RepID=UPI00360F49B7